MIRRALLLTLALGALVPPLGAAEWITDTSSLGPGHFSLQVQEIAKGDLVVNLNALLEGLAAVTVEVPGQGNPFIGTAIRGQHHRDLKEADTMVYLDRGSFGTLPVRSRLRQDLAGVRELHVNLYFEDGRHLAFPIRSAGLPTLNVRIAFNRLRCAEITIECKSKGNCASCSNTITCCGALTPCVTCPGCGAVCGCEIPPDPPTC